MAVDGSRIQNRLVARRVVIVLAVSLALVSALVVSGCLGGDAEPPPVGAGDEPGEPDVVLQANCQPTDEEQAWIDEHLEKAGVFIKKYGQYRFVLVTMGQKPTGGFEVEVANVTSSGEEWTVDAVFTSPGPSDIVTQAITYPYQFVKIKDDGKVIRVRDVTAGEAVELEATGE